MIEEFSELLEIRNAQHGHDGNQIVSVDMLPIA